MAVNGQLHAPAVLPAMNRRLGEYKFQVFERNSWFMPAIKVIVWTLES